MNRKKKDKDKKTSSRGTKRFPTGGESFFSLRRGNITLTRLLLLVNSEGPDGISTMKLFRELGTTGYGQTTLRRALKAGLIERVTGESEHGQFPPVSNIITARGKQLLQKHQLLY